MKRWTAAACFAAACLAVCHGPALRAQSPPDAALFDDTVLHRVDLYVNSRDWYFLKANYQSNDYYPANFRWNGQTVRNVAIRSRGLGSRNQVKPGLRVDFNRYANGQRFLGLKSVILDNLTQDPSMIHEVVAMKVFRRMGVPASRESLATVYVNNEYMGVYAIIEEPDDISMAKMYGDGSGYLYEYKWFTEWHFEYLGSDLEAYRPYFEPRTHDTESAVALYQPIESMVRTFNEASDEQFEEQASAYIDFNDWIKHTAIQAYTSEFDGLLGNWGLSNFYLYRPTGGKRHRIVPWDEDNAFALPTYPIDAFHKDNVLMRRIMERPGWRQAYFDTVLAVAASVEEGGEPIPDWPGELGGGWLERETARLQALIHDAAIADTKKPPENDFEAASEAMIAFTRTRGGFVRSEVARLAR